VLPTADLIVNCTSVGQSGIRAAGEGRVTVVEPYSPLSAAGPAEVPDAGSAELTYRAVSDASLDDIARNNDSSLRLLASSQPSADVLDIVYAPLETTLMRHARFTGHRAMNGKAMNVCQAAAAMFDYVCADYLETRGLRTPATYERILALMYEVW
jgi:shikimate 5-dehydrogenase